jgi:hypothetical protein
MVRAKGRTNIHMMTVRKYRIIPNFLTPFMKSVHLDGGKECKCDLKMDRETVQFF